MFKNDAQSVLQLYPYDTVLIGRYPEGVGVVLVELYSTVRAFSVTLPSLFSSKKTQFFFKNFGTNSVTLNTSDNEDIDYPGTRSHVITTGKFYSLMSNNKDHWVSLE